MIMYLILEFQFNVLMIVELLPLNDRWMVIEWMLNGHITHELTLNSDIEYCYQSRAIPEPHSTAAHHEWVAGGYSHIFPR